MISSIIKTILRSPTGYWGTGNCLASVGVSWIGIFGNIGLALFSLYNEIRESLGTKVRSKKIDSTESEETPSHVKITKEWLNSPGIFPAIDTFVVAGAAIETLYGGYIFKGLAFSLFALGGPGAVTLMSKDYWNKHNITAPLGKSIKVIWDKIPKLIRSILLSTGMWWCSGDIILGISELSLETLKTSLTTSLCISAAILCACYGLVNGILSAFKNASNSHSLLAGTFSYALFAVSNLSASHYILGAAFAFWTMSNLLLTLRHNKLSKQNTGFTGADALGQPDFSI